MIKKYRWQLIISSLITLIPVLVGLLLWDKLPATFASHWGINGKADGFSNKAVNVFVLPGILLLLHWVCLAFSLSDLRNNNQNKKAVSIAFWVIPITSLFTASISYSTAFGREVNFNFLLPALLGLLFLVLGNYLPKIKPNRTIGIKVPWTLNSDANWYATHRFASKIWVVGGFLLLLSIALPQAVINVLFPVIVLALIIVPAIYSYWFFAKNKNCPRDDMDDEAEEASSDNKSKRKEATRGVKASLIIGLVIIAAIVVLSFTGSIHLKYNEKSFEIQATYWGDLTVDYDAVKSIKYEVAAKAGNRTNGYGSARLLLGSFRNSDYGSYTRYAYNGCKHCIIMDVDGKTLVLSGIDDTETKTFYENLKERIDS